VGREPNPLPEKTRRENQGVFGKQGGGFGSMGGIVPSYRKKFDKEFSGIKEDLKGKLKLRKKK